MEQIRQDFATLTRALNAFVQTFDEEYTCELGADFEAVDDLQIIYAIASDAVGAQHFFDNFVKCFPACADFDVWTLSFMHELGHLETSFDQVNDIKARERVHKIKNMEKKYQAYYNLYNERIATEWAGEYLTANHDTMKEWEKKIFKILKKTLDKYPD